MKILKSKLFVSVFILILAITIILNFIVPVGMMCPICVEGGTCPPCQNLYMYNSNPSPPVLVIDLIISFVLSLIIVFAIRKFSKKV
ncbi:MAG: hypothetical protein WCI04_06140 [archaeon]